MHPDKPARTDVHSPQAHPTRRDDSGQTTPAADLQADDAISPDLSHDLGADGTPSASQPRRTGPSGNAQDNPQNKSQDKSQDKPDTPR